MAIVFPSALSRGDFYSFQNKSFGLKPLVFCKKREKHPQAIAEKVPTHPKELNDFAQSAMQEPRLLQRGDKKGKTAAAGRCDGQQSLVFMRVVDDYSSQILV